MKKNLKKYLVLEKYKVRLLIEKIRKHKNKILIVINLKKKVTGIITPGDLFKEKIFKNMNLSARDVMNKKFRFINNQNEIFNIFNKNFDVNILHVPLIKKNKLINIFFYDKIIQLFKSRKFFFENTKILIMAGGYGRRMGFFTLTKPKPLIKDKNKKTVLENMVRFFFKYKLKNISISTFYKKENIISMIKKKFSKKKIEILKEEKPLGSIGSLAFFKNKKFDNILVINCDTLLNINPNIIIDFHIRSKNDLTIVSGLVDQSSSYGHIFLNNKREISSIVEKPISRKFVNTGIYIFKKNIIKNMAINKKIDADQLIQRLLKNKKIKVKIFPLYKTMWKDIGTFEKYRSYLKN